VLVRLARKPLPHRGGSHHSPRFPNAAIVHCRRHPLDTCLSIFCTDFEAAIDFAGERRSLVFFYRP